MPIPSSLLTSVDLGLAQLEFANPSIIPLTGVPMGYFDIQLAASKCLSVGKCTN